MAAIPTAQVPRRGRDARAGGYMRFVRLALHGSSGPGSVRRHVPKGPLRAAGGRRPGGGVHGLERRAGRLLRTDAQPHRAPLRTVRRGVRRLGRLP
jgi:hypothetical protein